MNLCVERYRGALVGLATGDALGTTLEFSRPGTFEPLADMIGEGPFGLQPGEWTDDTSMALCLAESLIERGGFDAADQMRRYVAWYREGHLGSTGTCFDIGITVRAALHRFEETGDPFAGSTDERSAGNGSLMRLAPVPLAFASETGRVLEYAALSSRTTHGAAAAVDACRFYALLIVAALRGEGRAAVLDPDLVCRCGAEWDSFHPEIRRVGQGSYKQKSPPDIRGTGYVVESMEAALWAFARSATFEDGALAAVNLGDDADTTGAVYGQLAGAFYGIDGIPGRWRSLIKHRDLIERYADRLLDLAQGMRQTVRSST